MENLELQPKENVQVAEIPEQGIVDVYKGASMLRLTPEEQKDLMHPADAEDYEIRPDGFIYLPAALVRKKLNDVIGIGQWAIIGQGTRKEDSEKSARVFYDGILMIRGNYISRSTGESVYSFTNQNQSWASAVEAAKTDCLTRCAKDIGIATEGREPRFIRDWQKTFAVRVFCKDDYTGKIKVFWRRKDVDPFYNETGLVPVNPQPSVKPKEEPAMKGQPVTDEWQETINACKNITQLTALYNENKHQVDEWPELKATFKKAQEAIKTKFTPQKASA